MTKLLLKALAVSCFFVLIGAVVDKVGARFKSDEKALDIIKKARLAIGGDSAISQVRSLVITGRSTRTFSLDGVDKTEQGDTEIAFQLPDKMMKTIKIGDHDGSTENAAIEKKVEVVVVGGDGGEQKVIAGGNNGEFTTRDGKNIVIRRTQDPDGKVGGTEDVKVFVRKAGDGDKLTTEGEDVKEITTEDGKKIIIRRAGDGNAAWTASDGKTMTFDHKMMADHAAMRNNELLRTTLSLLVSAPEGLDVSYTFAGEGDVNGTPVNSVVASFGGSNYKLYFDKYSNLPVGISFTGHSAPFMVKFRKEGGDPNAKADTLIFDKKLQSKAEAVEQFVTFSDYRSVGGVQMPYRWTTTVGGKVSEVFDVTSYDLNPANIADRFKGEKVMIRMKKPDVQ